MIIVLIKWLYSLLQKDFSRVSLLLEF